MAPESDLSRHLLPGGILLLSITSFAPALAAPVSQEWAVRMEAPAQAYLQANAMTARPAGDLFLAGQVQYHGFNNDLWIARRGSDGSNVWESIYQPPEGLAGDEIAYAITTHGTHVYVAGTSTRATGNSSRDILTLKYRDTGQFEWAARYDGGGQFTDLATAVAVDAAGNVLVVGDSIGTNGTFNIVVLKYGPAGNLLWTYSYDGPEHGSDRSVGLRVDGNGNVYVGGTTDEASQPSGVAFKLNAVGNLLWVAHQTSPYGLRARGFDVDPEGNVAMVGMEHFYCTTWKYDAGGNRQWLARYRAEPSGSLGTSDVRFDSQGDILAAANLYSSGANDAVIVKYAADGRQLWATRIAHPDGTSQLRNLELDAGDNAYVTISPAFDAVTVKVSPQGAQLWTVAYNSGGFFYDYGEFLSVTPAGDIFVAGRSSYFSETFLSIVKYTQQPVPGVVTAVATPALQVVDPGTNLVLQAETFGAVPLSFQWRKGGRPIEEATSATYTLTNVQVLDRADYSVVVSNLAGSTVSPDARILVRTPPEVSIAPTQVVAYVSMDVTFVATVVGNDFAALQWRKDGANIPGATNDELRLTVLSLSDSGTYDIVVSTFGGTTTSSAAGLRISRAVELIGTTPHQGSLATYDYMPQLKVLPSGEYLLASRSNHSAGASIVLQRHAAHGSHLWTASFADAVCGIL